MTTRSNKPKLTGEARETASRMWKSGASASEIGAALGVNRSTIVGVAYRDRVNFPMKGKGKGYKRRHGPLADGWTNEMLDRAASLWADGMMIDHIAEKMGLTRYSIASIAKRRRDKFPERVRGGNRGRKVAEKRPDRVKSDYKFGVKSQPRTPTCDRSTFDLSRMPYAKTLVEIGPCQCRWALTDEGPHLFCAEVTEVGSAWCAHHAERALGSGTYSERHAVWDAKRIAA